MNENKEFQINLIGETIMRNSEGIYASKSPEIDVEIVVDKDYVIDALVRNIQIQENILQSRFDTYVSAKREAIQKNLNAWEKYHDDTALRYDFQAREVRELAFLLGFDLKQETKGE
ncbi:hypothetical protein ABEQ78_17375 [Bacillus altitudinis]|uniref:hypothetical protein n=1 Tax=Bacillus TaxID=1386 RepID=UPI002281B163|nr:MULTISPECIES: hypothetical protein [Bacillus]MCY7575926.1 hypothetical protein [Bacillus pumilus]MED0850961.1 hypothetical protein [Bacillus altitudinis]